MAFWNKSKLEEVEEDSPSFVSSLSSFLGIIVLVFAFKSSILDANNIPSGSMIPTLKIGDFLFVNKMRYSLRIPFTEKEIYRIDDPRRGDIVTFIPPDDALNYGETREGIFSKRFVKRVIGMPGDTIRLTRKYMETSKGRILYAFIEYRPIGSDSFLDYAPEEVPQGKELADVDDIRASSGTLFRETKGEFQHLLLETSDDIRNAGARFNCDFSNGCLIPDGHYMVMGDNRDNSHDSRGWGFVPREDILGKALIIYFSINWKDHTCQFKDGLELSEKGPYEAEKWDAANILNYCQPNEIDSYGNSSSSEEFEPRMDWLKRTILYRIWRMDVRWDRIGRLLK
ncbi:signal peptidase I [Leptospira sp. GIMC2001]|uniref:signal peptidase I n=1 Tax=Leptospira sp. GIMC2001 TaxID=1513297 RepID=UPI00234980F7|nr:signal peptidase I [Leptospira sp. GIMC2001]WCL48933.1 signal peptidase I [Leptospira sp. GIMC2001]